MTLAREVARIVHQIRKLQPTCSILIGWLSVAWVLFTLKTYNSWHRRHQQHSITPWRCCILESLAMFVVQHLGKTPQPAIIEKVNKVLCAMICVLARVSLACWITNASSTALNLGVNSAVLGKSRCIFTPLHWGWTHWIYMHWKLCFFLQSRNWLANVTIGVLDYHYSIFHCIIF